MNPLHSTLFWAALVLALVTGAMLWLGQQLPAIAAIITRNC